MEAAEAAGTKQTTCAWAAHCSGTLDLPVHVPHTVSCGSAYSCSYEYLLGSTLRVRDEIDPRSCFTEIAASQVEGATLQIPDELVPEGGKKCQERCNALRTRTARSQTRACSRCGAAVRQPEAGGVACTPYSVPVSYQYEYSYEDEGKGAGGWI